MRFFASISYNGASFSGWQIQQNAPSIQAEVQRALSAILQEEIEVYGAGRTDSGVNAINYIAHFDSANTDILSRHEELIYKINAILPYDIVLNRIFQVKENAHARFNATKRTYKYYVHSGKEPFLRPFSWHCKFHLDVEKMNQAAALLIGKKDFSCFEKLHGGSNTSICDLTSAKWERYTPQLSSDCEGDFLCFTVTANRFLRNMVRAIVGTMIEVGRGKKEPEWILELLASGNRCAAGQSVPGNALFLTEIHYPEDIFINE